MSSSNEHAALVPATDRRVVRLLGIFALGCGLILGYGVGASTLQRVGGVGDVWTLLLIEVPLGLFAGWCLIVGYQTLRTNAPPALRSLSAIFALALYYWGAGVIAMLFPIERGLDGMTRFSVLNLILLILCSSIYIAVSQRLISARTGEPFRIHIPQFLIVVIGFHVWIVCSSLFLDVAEAHIRARDDAMGWWSLAALFVPIIAVTAVVKLMQRLGKSGTRHRSFVLTTRSPDTHS